MTRSVLSKQQLTWQDFNVALCAFRTCHVLASVAQLALELILGSVGYLKHFYFLFYFLTRPVVAVLFVKFIGLLVLLFIVDSRSNNFFVSAKKGDATSNRTSTVSLH